MTTISVGLRTAHGSVDLLGVEPARLVVERLAAEALADLDDPGDAFEIADDEDVHRRR
jgi:hypothetical protein